MMRPILQKILLCCYVLLPSLSLAQDNFNTKAGFAILQDFETGKILYAKNADARMYPASMTKIMTAYLLFEELKSGRLDFSDSFGVSKKAYSTGGSRMFLEVGERVAIEDLVRGIIVQSGNDASVATAENIAGSEIAFADLMNDTAKRLGMDNSHFVNASGWPDEDHYTTAKDLLRLAEATIKDFPDYYKYYAETEFTYAGIRQANRNPLLFDGIGVDGLKTGHTEASGYGLAASAAARGRRLLMVINGLNSEAERARESMRLMEWGLRNFDNYRLLVAGDEVAKASVTAAQAKEIGLVVKEDILLTLSRVERRALEVEAEYDAPLIAPVSSDEAVGILRLSVRGKEVATYPIYAAENIAALSFFGKIKKRFDGLLGR